MKDMDCVEIIMEKECYMKDGVHKGMQGGFVLIQWCIVNYCPQCDDNENIATVSIKDTDIKHIPHMDTI